VRFDQLAVQILLHLWRLTGFKVLLVRNFFATVSSPAFAICGTNSTPFMVQILLHLWYKFYSICGTNSTPFMEGDARDVVCHQVLECGDGYVNSVSFRRDGMVIAAVDSEGNLVMWKRGDDGMT
jgi:hypothetical protein